MLDTHPGAALEYWFFKVNVGLLALLVDWIARRKAGEYVVRVSIHSPDKRAVLFEKLVAPGMDERNYLRMEHTAGQLGEIAWELDVDAGMERIAPQIFPAPQLRLFDMTLVSAPLATFTGWIQVGATRVELQRTPGLLSHYWGRQLPRQWWWVSAHQFDRDDVVVECMALRSAVWGFPLRLPLGYLYLRVGSQRRLWIAPPVLTRISGSPQEFEIEFRPISAAPIRLKGQGRDYGDLGDGIVNTLVGNLEVWQGETLLARAAGTAGLERRAPDR
jgi:hypothetical protein